MSHPEPFDRFLAHTAAARPEDYADDLRAAAGRLGLSPEQAVAEFEHMKAYILRYYEGVHPVRSFLDTAGLPVDCVPFEQQPSVRAAEAAGHPVPAPATPSRSDSRASSVSLPPGAARSAAAPRPEPENRLTLCPAGTIPLLRITLERLIRLGTLETYFRKAPPPTPARQG